MRYIHHISRSFVMLGLLAFVLVLGFSGMAMADDKAAETTAAGEAPTEGEAPADDEKKAEGETKASDAK